MGRKKTNIVISSWKGIVTLRSKPTKVKQTPNTVEAGRLFGMASNCSGIIRKLLKSLLPEPANRTVMHRLQKAFYHWVKTGVLTDNKPIENISFFNGLSLNEKSELSQWLKFSPAVSRLPDGQLSLTFPAFDPVQQVKAPEATTAIIISIAVAGLQMGNPAIQTSW